MLETEVEAIVLKAKTEARLRERQRIREITEQVRLEAQRKLKYHVSLAQKQIREELNKRCSGGRSQPQPNLVTRCGGAMHGGRFCAGSPTRCARTRRCRPLRSPPSATAPRFTSYRTIRVRRPSRRAWSPPSSSSTAAAAMTERLGEAEGGWQGGGRRALLRYQQRATFLIWQVPQYVHSVGRRRRRRHLVRREIAVYL